MRASHAEVGATTRLHSTDDLQLTMFYSLTIYQYIIEVIIK